jgi:uncharacterized protein (DUF1015 family)
MANVAPFKGVLYDPEVVKDVSKVVAPPYDVIDPAYQHALHERDPHNIIRLELGLDRPDDDPSENRYTRARGSLHDWLRTGVLRRDPLPALYVYTIDYRPPGGENGWQKTLKGFLATVELEEFGTGRIFPHENTRSAAKADRLELLKACRANFSPIFSLFSDEEGRVLARLEQECSGRSPRLEFTDDSGFRHRLWSVADGSAAEEVTSLMKPKPLFIADGHHRYETALAYRQFRREHGSAPSGAPQPYDRVLMLFAALEDPGLTVLPTHRVLTTPLPPFPEVRRRLEEAFEIDLFEFDRNEPDVRRTFLRELRRRGSSGTVFGLAVKDLSSYALLMLKPSHRPARTVAARDQLDVSILQTRILNVLCPAQADQEAMVYTKDDGEALDLVRRGKAHAAWLLNPTKVGEVRAVAASGGRMPHKSTYFFPKPLTGLVINVMEE